MYMYMPMSSKSHASTVHACISEYIDVAVVARAVFRSSKEANVNL
jgi:hypothetical protein